MVNKKKSKKPAARVIWVCRGEPHTKDRGARTMRALRNGGKGLVTITADDAHLLKNIFNCLDTTPQHSGIYSPKQNDGTRKLAERLKKQVCEFCEGQGWVIGNMGESADPCPRCDGSGLNTTRRKK